MCNTRQPMLTLIEDTSPGVHDMLFAACDRWRYAQLGVAGYHASCVENLQLEVRKMGDEGLDVQGVESLMEGDFKWAPDPLNLFMNVPVKPLGGGGGGELGIERPIARKGEYVVLRAETDCVVVMSACPMDLNMVNGGVCRGVEFEVV